MSTLAVINDVHLGAKRQAGTTLTSRLALANYLFDGFNHLLDENRHNDILILGDLFDGFVIDTTELIRCFNSLSDWIHETGRTLYLVSGNHDYSAKGDKVSSFQLLCHFLCHTHTRNVVVITHDHGFTTIRPGIHVISHCLNQDLFELELQKAMESDESGWLLLHCNVKNKFTEESDHSLNLSETWCDRLLSKYRLMVAHEHQQKNDSDILVIGNQFPSSVADCMGNSTKRYMGICPDLGITSIETWRTDHNFLEVDWRELADVGEGFSFIRVVGEATVEESVNVVNAIARFRSNSKAFVVSNAVKIDGLPNMEELSYLNAQDIKSFNVLQALLECLTPEEGDVVKEVLNNA